MQSNAIKEGGTQSRGREYLSQQVVLLRWELFVAEHACHQGCELEEIEGVRLVRIKLSHEGIELRVRDLVPEERANQSSSAALGANQSAISGTRRQSERNQSEIRAQSARNLVPQLLDGEPELVGA